MKIISLETANKLIQEDKLLAKLGIKTVEDLNEYCKNNPINIGAFVSPIKDIKDSL